MIGLRRSRSRRELAGLAVSGAVIAATERATQLAERARDGAGELAGELADRSQPLRDRVVEGAGELAERAQPLRERVVDGAGELVVAGRPVVGSAVETVSGVLEEALERGGAAWDALRADRVVPAPAVRRWPWAVGAALAGAAAGGVAAVLLRKIAPADAPGAQEPHELRAVVDTDDGLTTRASVVPPSRT